MSVLNRPYPTEVLTHFWSGYAINVPAEWQDTASHWWRDPAAARIIDETRRENGVVLHDALWAVVNGEPEPSLDGNNYSFDEATQSYTRTDVRV